MSTHLSDRTLLAELIRIGESILLRPFDMAPGRPFNLAALGDDLAVARRCPSHGSPIGAAEAILFVTLQTISTGGAATGAELARYGFIAQQALAIVRDHYFAIALAEETRRRAGMVRP